MSKHKAQTKQQELRTTLEASQLKVRGGTGEMKLGGYAVVFNSPANIGGQFTESIAPGSFTRTLQEDDQILLRDHQSFLLLGRRSAGNLTLRQDPKGVVFEVVLPETELGRDTYECARLGLLKGCSFGFIVRDDVWSNDAEGNLVRVIKDLQCFEVTLTSMPAYDQTSVDVRSIRATLAQRDSDDITDDDLDCDGEDADDPRCEDRCQCDCAECQSDSCEECSDPDCDADDCLSCPAQTRAAHQQLLIRRLK